MIAHASRPTLNENHAKEILRVTKDDFTVGHDFNNDGGRYWVEVAGGSAELTYKNRGDGVIIIDHTFVPLESRGRDVAQQLVEHAVRDARLRNLKIVPLSPYVDKLFRARADLNKLRAA